MVAELDNEKLLTYYRSKFPYMFINILQQVLINNNAILAGGAVLAPYAKTSISDFDIYVHEKNAQSLFAQLANIIITPFAMWGNLVIDSYNHVIFEISQEEFVPLVNQNNEDTLDNVRLPILMFDQIMPNVRLQPPYDRSFFLKNNIIARIPMRGRGFTQLSMFPALFDTPTYRKDIKIDLLVVDNKVELTSVPKNFDLSFCKIWWTGEKVFATNPDDVRTKNGTLSPDYIQSLLEGNTFTLNRIKKYKSKGFTVSIPSMCIQEFSLARPKKEIISDERWIVSKILEQIFKMINVYFPLPVDSWEHRVVCNQCFETKIKKILDRNNQDDMSKYDSYMFILNALTNFNPNYNGEIFSIENLKELYVKMFNFYELDLQGLTAALNTPVTTNDQFDSLCVGAMEEATTNTNIEKYMTLKEEMLQTIKSISLKVWKGDEWKEYIEQINNVPEKIQKDVKQRVMEVMIYKCYLADFYDNLVEIGQEKYAAIIAKTFKIQEDGFEIINIQDPIDNAIHTLQWWYVTSGCNQQKLFNITSIDYVMNQQYNGKINAIPRTPYYVIINEANKYKCQRVLGYNKPLKELGGLLEPNQVFDTEEECENNKVRIIEEIKNRREEEDRERKEKARARIQEEREKMKEQAKRFAEQYGEEKTEIIPDDIEDFPIPRGMGASGILGMEEVPGKCYKSEDSSKTSSKKWYEEGNILLYFQFSEVDSNAEDTTVCVSKEYLIERMNEPTNIYFTCNGPRAAIINGPRTNTVVNIEDLNPDERYHRLPIAQMDPNEKFVKINRGENVFTDEDPNSPSYGEVTVSTSIPAYLRYQDVRRIINLSNDPNKVRVFSLIPDGERTHTVTQSVIDGDSVVGGFHCQNNSVIHIFKVREFIPSENPQSIPSTWADIEETKEEGDIIEEKEDDIPIPYSSTTPSYNPNAVISPFTTPPSEGTEVLEQERPSEDTVIESDVRILPGQVEEQDYIASLDDLRERLDNIYRNQPITNHSIRRAHKEWKTRLSSIEPPYSDDNIIFLSRLRRWMDAVESIDHQSANNYRPLGPDDFQPDPPLEDLDQEVEHDDTNIARQLFADDQSVDENEG